MGSDDNLKGRLARYRGGAEGLALARDLLDAGQAADALDVATRASSAAPDDPELAVVAGRARLASGDLLGAEATLLRALRKTPRHEGALRWLAEALMARGDHKRAAQVAERAVQVSPDDAALAELLDAARSGRSRPRTTSAEGEPAPGGDAGVVAASASRGEESPGAPGLGVRAGEVASSFGAPPSAGIGGERGVGPRGRLGRGAGAGFERGIG